MFGCKSFYSKSGSSHRTVNLSGQLITFNAQLIGSMLFRLNLILRRSQISTCFFSSIQAISNFALTINRVPGPKGALRDEPMYHITRDGFALLAMGFTGKEAMRWKEAYIAAFNAMEARLKSLYVEPLVEGKQFRNGIPLHMKFKLQEQSFQIMGRLMTERQAAARRNLYWQLRQVNDALGIPTESAEQLLGTDAPALPVQEGGAA